MSQADRHAAVLEAATGWQIVSEKEEEIASETVWLIVSEIV